MYLDFYGDGVRKDIFDNLIEIDAESVEVMTHPAIVDNDLRQVSSYIEMREQELEILCSLAVPDWVDLQGKSKGLFQSN